MKDLKLFVQLAKVDAAQRIVYGTAVTETPDFVKEVFDYDTSKPLFEAWSEKIHKATDGKSMGNVRAMHGKVAAGKLTQIGFDDTRKAIDVAAKIVDDAEWAKVQEGVYTGFSIGGRYVKKWKDGDNQRYTAEPAEISLVDLPCIADAQFSMIKADGSQELRKFKSAGAPEVPVIANDAIAAKATELAKAAGDETKWVDHIAAAREELTKAAAPAPVVKEPVVEKTAEPAKVEPEAKAAGDGPWEQVWVSKDLPNQQFKTKGELRAALLEKSATDDVAKKAAPVTDALAAIGAELTKRDGGPAKVEPTAKDAAKVNAGDGKTPRVCKIASMATFAQDLAKIADPARSADLCRKGLYDVGRLAGLISELKWLQDALRWEALTEGDGSAVPGQLKASLVMLCDVLCNLVAEETAEFISSVPDVAIIELAAGMLPHGHIDALVKLSAGTPDLAKVNDVLQKVGARHSKPDNERIGKAHDLLVELGATCGGDAAKNAPAELAKRIDELSKLTAERDALAKQLDGLVPTLTDILTRVKKIEAQPMPGGPARMAGPVSKERDGLDVTKTIEGMSAEDLLTTVIKAAQSQGRVITQIGQSA